MDRYAWDDRMSPCAKCGFKGLHICSTLTEEAAKMYTPISVKEQGRKAADDPINPNHYKFPSGAEVIQITENLTGNAAQAVNYIARSSRLDGFIKDDPLQDLNKAKWFIEREIQRIRQQRAIDKHNNTKTNPEVKCDGSPQCPHCKY